MKSSPPTDWNAWLEAEAAKFLLFARQQTRCEQDAEDVLQEALVEAWRRGGGVPDRALVFTIIRNRAIDLGRRQDRRARLNETEAAATETAWLDSAVLDRETKLLLESAVKALPPELRDVVTLKVWGGLTFAAAAEALGIPQGTAATRYRCALELLRSNLTPVLT